MGPEAASRRLVGRAEADARWRRPASADVKLHAKSAVVVES